MILGQVDGEDVILVRRGDKLFAVGAACTHYHGPLAEGLIVGETVRCPWHHACFSLRTGEALRAPALDPVACWRVERIGDEAYVREKLASPTPKATLGTQTSHNLPSSIVIIGGGAAGLAAADMLRREGYEGRITMISADHSAPYDRPNLSKDFLAGTASDDWIPLRSPDFYEDRRIELVLGSRVSALDLKQKRAQLENGKTYGLEALLIATGAEPVKLKIDGATDSQINYLRVADSKAIVAKAASAKRVAVVGPVSLALRLQHPCAHAVLKWMW
jgi:nitrite reductase/ring-hydroxylating ferredoxin subunit